MSCVRFTRLPDVLWHYLTKVHKLWILRKSSKNRDFFHEYIWSCDRRKVFCDNLIIKSRSVPDSKIFDWYGQIEHLELEKIIRYMRFRDAQQPVQYVNTSIRRYDAFCFLVTDLMLVLICTERVV